VPRAATREKARRGGLNTIERGGLRVQIIRKTYEGGNYFDHVHVGVSCVVATA
jgi:hypothetical protein